VFGGRGGGDEGGKRLGHDVPAGVRMGVLSRPGTSCDGVEDSHGVGMNQYVFKMPDLGEGTVDAEIVGWHAKPGDAVTEDQIIVEVMTDKAAVEAPAPESGRVVTITRPPAHTAPAPHPLTLVQPPPPAAAHRGPPPPAHG